MTAKMFDKVLIANRGEIACRIVRTCRRLGVRTAAVYSDADAASFHVRMADEAVHIGPSPAQESYLVAEKIIAAARRTSAQAIHPGYGFLSENEHFAEACADAGIVFIGPPASAIHAMGSKSAAKDLMQQAGVPLTPGYHGEKQSPEFLLAQADAISYPVLIKASAGGGGKGMRRVDRHADFLDALASCKREATASFGDDHVLIEKYILQPRHIEIQVFADTFGNVVSLFERDCSVQRRHQKVLEEAPAPGMAQQRRAAMSKAACDAARAVGYVGAGTVEFIADATGAFHFMEMNTRLQVEHPVTEMITGLDLVEWQLRVAAGEPLPLNQEELSIHGHAIEARIYAEDPAENFRPSVGILAHLQIPQPSAHVRVDAGVEEADAITPFYDPMIAKLIVWEDTREQALATMTRSLSELQIVGVQTNVQFLKRLVETPSFQSAALDTSLIEREADSLFAKPAEPPAETAALVALAVLESERTVAQPHHSPWSVRDGWRMNGTLRRTLRLAHSDQIHEVLVEYRGDGFVATVSDQSFALRGSLTNNSALTATINGLTTHSTLIRALGDLTIFNGYGSYTYTLIDPLASSAAQTTTDAGMLAPMPGLVTNLLVRPGERVERGAPLLTLEAMKMEYTIKAPSAGSVQAFFFAPGDQVSDGVQLLSFEPAAKEDR